KAQSQTDSIINSIFPVSWNFDFSCYPVRIADTPSVNSEWADELLGLTPMIPYQILETRLFPFYQIPFLLHITF
ncbi:MAG TPA: hypothetical protein VFX22_11085, partial [Candidatus Kapabacteria bacterium]|nr:hypothetical protein [Candidatus Kapabacteria bacterium]